MDETKQIDDLKSLASAVKERSLPGKRVWIASVRVSAGAYVVASSVLTFSAGLLVRSEQDAWALLATLVAWALLPALALTDRIAFDGDSLVRRGAVPFALQLISGRRQQLSLAEVERVDTNAVRTLRRGGRVRYRYRSQITGRGTGFAIASGGRRYREMVERLFPLIHDDKIDLRTRELRDYLCDPNSLDRELGWLKLAPSDVLDNATPEFKLGGKIERADQHRDAHEISPSDVQRAIMLRHLGNKLRIAGRLREAGEAFRRALNVLPRDGRLIYDFARLLRSQASARGDARLLSRARAALRLSAMRSDEDAALLSLIGEGFLECNEAARAERSFQRAIQLEPRTFRARLGLADVALRNGKLAHVIHQYRDAALEASEKALVRYARREADYYVRLNEDDDYLSAELSRINWLQTLTRVRRLAARVTNASLLVALIGTYADQAIAGVAWAVASSSLVAWLASLGGGRLLSARRKPRPID
jgi:tetratricopeptide (TPR) repeat protein